MSLSIHSTAPAVAAANAPTQVTVAPSAPKDTVQISTAAQTALQESRETQAQTAQEAAHGDRQAVKLLAKETASK
jgi:hypothetical protein